MKSFKKFKGEQIPDLGQYVRDYIKENVGNTIYIGCDSDPKGKKRGNRKRGLIPYATTVAFYDEERKSGVHYIFDREYEPRPKVKFIKTGNKARDKELSRKALTGSIFQRIWLEVEKAEAVGEYFEKELAGYYRRKSPEELIKMGYSPHQNKLVCIDLDINPVPGWTPYQLELIRIGESPGIPKNRSNIVYDAARSYLVGKGYRVRFKPDSWASSCSADLICKRG